MFVYFAYEASHRVCLCVFVFVSMCVCVLRMAQNFMQLYAGTFISRRFLCTISTFMTFSSLFGQFEGRGQLKFSRFTHCRLFGSIRPPWISSLVPPIVFMSSMRQASNQACGSGVTKIFSEEIRYTKSASLFHTSCYPNQVDNACARID